MGLTADIDWFRIKLAKEIRIKRVAGGKTFFVDGVEFPFHVHPDTRVTVQPDPYGTGDDATWGQPIRGLTLTLLAETLIDETEET